MEKAFWMGIKEQEGAVPEGYTAIQLLPELMAGLGSLDPELRDGLCFEILAYWIGEGRFTDGEVQQITEQLLANLRVGIGEGENDQVFLRTFSVLVLAYGVVPYDRQKGVLPEGLRRRILDEGLRYLADEQDLRGYAPDKGWAHSVAHTADLLREVAAHAAFGAEDLERILYGIGEKVLAPTHYALIDNEDGRLVRAVMKVLHRELVPLERLVAWVASIGGEEPRHKAYVAGRDNARYHNVRAFLKALHVFLSHPEMPLATREVLQPAVYQALKSFTPWGM